MTTRLYYEDAYLTKCKAKIIEIQERKGKFGVVLDKTCFYPEGGGQPGDIGTLNHMQVEDTQLEAHKIYHIIDKSIPIGTSVELELNWEHRYELMQAHTGQHLLSACFWELMQGETFSVHLGKNSFSIDIKLPNISWQDVARLEAKANQMIFLNKPVQIHWHETVEELSKYPFRRLPKKKGEGGYRIVIIKDLDYSACGGTHVKTTGELGLLKISKWMKIKDGIRVEYVCGSRSLADYQQKSLILRHSLEKFHCSEEELLPLIEKTHADLSHYRDQTNDLTKKLMIYEVPELIAQAQQIEDSYLIIQQFSNRTMGDLRELETKIIKNKKAIVIFTNLTEETNKLQLLFGRSPEFSQKDLNMGTLLRETAKILEGKGGGKPEFAQGGGKPANLAQALEFIEKKIKSIIDG